MQTRLKIGEQIIQKLVSFKNLCAKPIFHQLFVGKRSLPNWSCLLSELTLLNTLFEYHFFHLCRIVSGLVIMVDSGGPWATLVKVHQVWSVGQRISLSRHPRGYRGPISNEGAIEVRYTQRRWPMLSIESFALSDCDISSTTIQGNCRPSQWWRSLLRIHLHKVGHLW